MPKLRRSEARRLQLWAQGLGKKRQAPATKADVLTAIQRMKLLQIDTIHVVARSPFLVLFARLGAYEPRWLMELLEEGKLIECWAHEACFAPVETYPLIRRQQLLQSRHWSMRHALRMQAAHKKEMQAILRIITREGPRRAADFEAKERGQGGWWGWKAEKRWLEALFALGELMITRREGFQRVYDLRDRVLAKHWPDPTRIAIPSAEEQAERFVLDAVEALGVVQSKEIADYFRTGKKHKDAALERWVLQGELERVEVEGWDAPGYARPGALEQIPKRGAPTTLLSPFDPIVWDRARTRGLFDFDYRIECYVPGPKRKFGYYVLPILDGDRLVGRLDAKAHRAEQQMEIKALYFEEPKPSAALRQRLRGAIQAFADWHQTPELRLSAAVQRALRGS